MGVEVWGLGFGLWSVGCGVLGLFCLVQGSEFERELFEELVAASSSHIRNPKPHTQSPIRVEGAGSAGLRGRVQEVQGSRGESSLLKTYW